MPTLPADQDLILFDAQCVFCSGFARFMHKHDRAGSFRFVTAQSQTGRALYLHHNLDPDLMETNIVIVGGAAHIKLRAFAAAMRCLGAPWSVLGLLAYIPQTPSDWFYDRIARNRYRFGRHACPIPPPELKARLIE